MGGNTSGSFTKSSVMESTMHVYNAKTRSSNQILKKILFYALNIKKTVQKFF